MGQKVESGEEELRIKVGVAMLNDLKLRSNL